MGDQIGPQALAERSVTEPLCPRQDELHEFALGKTVGAQWETVASHVEACLKCQKRLEILDQSDDELVTQLHRIDARSSAAATGGANGDERWVQAVLDLTSGGRRAASQ